MLKFTNRPMCRSCLKLLNRRKCSSTSSQARRIFLDYFVKDHGHRFVPSSSVLPKGDSTLLFTTAGMNQFKPIFLENYEEARIKFDRIEDLKRASNSQKCIRVGGKHNDFDDVGKDCHHHTFFEMLGNWSFGDYFKRDACNLAWKLLTGPYKIPPDRLYVTYFGGNANLDLEPDLECREIWREIGVSADRLLPFGMKDNFWDMGDTGPCGPCTEIHYSHLPLDQFVAKLVNGGNSKVIELWNLVFIQYCRKLDGGLEKLCRHHVDTGMGLERLTAVLNGNVSNYDTDLFQPLFTNIQRICGCPAYSGQFGFADVNGIDTAYRIIADHARMATVSIADGLLPDEIGPGHCLRRVIRRATMASMLSLKSKQALTSKLVPIVAENLGQTYENITSNLNKVIKVVSEEEDRFLKIISSGIKLFKKMTTDSTSSDIFSAEKIWELYFVHGIPEEFIFDLIASKGLNPELNKFQQLVNKEKLKTQRAYQRHLQEQKQSQVDVQFLMSSGILTTDDTHKYKFEKLKNGYCTIILDVLSFIGALIEQMNNVNSVARLTLHLSNQRVVVPDIESNIVAIWENLKFVKESHSSNNVLAFVTKETNFYSEAGGQAADLGIIISKVDNAKFEVSNVYSVNGYVVHEGRIISGKFCENDVVSLKVDSNYRSGCMRNHTATHLLNSVLHQVLSKTEQRSSKVATDYLRFDFATDSALPNVKLVEVEKQMATAIEKHLNVKRLIMPFSEAVKLPGFVTIPGENYPKDVAVIAICENESYISLEPCCGTHLINTRDIQDFVITSQKSQGQSVRSLRALVGPQAIQARKIALDIEEDIKQISSEIETKEFLKEDLFGYHRRLINARKMVHDGYVSVTQRDDFDKRIEGLQKKLVQITRSKVKFELNQSIPSFCKENFVVYLFKTNGHEQVVFAEAVKTFHSKPCFWFVKCGNKLHGRCIFSKDEISEQLNAETWSSVLIDNWAAEGKPSKKSPLVDYEVEMEIKDSNELHKIIENVRECGFRMFSS